MLDTDSRELLCCCRRPHVEMMRGRIILLYSFPSMVWAIMPVLSHGVLGWRAMTWPTQRSHRRYLVQK